MAAPYNDGAGYYPDQHIYQTQYHPVSMDRPSMQSWQSHAESIDYVDNAYSGHGYTGPVAGYNPNIEMQPLTSVPPTQGSKQPPAYNQDFDAGPTDLKAGATFEQAFRIERPRWNDLWAGILLLLVFLGFVGISGYSIAGYASSSSKVVAGTNAARIGLNASTLALFAVVLLVAIVLSVAYFALARLFTTQFIWISGVLNIVAIFATAAYFLYRHAWIGGLLMVLAGVFSILALIAWRSRIPFSVLMFQTTVDVAKRYGHVYLVSFVGGIITAALGALLAITLVAVWIRFEPDGTGQCKNGSFGGCSVGAVIGLFIYVTFAGYWISEWLKNTIHTIIAGVYGSWYFAPHNPPSGATRSAVRRALTYSFGSISLGSLVVAILDFLRFLCSAAQNSEANSGNFGADCAFCILGCILGCIQSVIEFINRYAFSYMALYGTSYFKSAKDTWKMIKDRGIDALINESLVGHVLSLGSFFVGIVCALISFLYLEIGSPSWNANHQYTIIVVVYSFLIGLQVASCVTIPLSSGMDTIFVATAWDPETLMREHSELYGQMIAVFPKVQEAIHA